MLDAVYPILRVGVFGNDFQVPNAIADTYPKLMGIYNPKQNFSSSSLAPRCFPQEIPVLSEK
jgi:hypothetical protein